MKPVLKGLIFFFGISVLALTPGCYNAEPISRQGTTPLDLRFYGNWRNDDGTVANVIHESGKYKITLHPSTKHEVIVTAFPSKFEGIHFLNVSVVKAWIFPPDPDAYTFYTYEFLDDNTLKIRGVNSEAVPRSLNTTKKIHKAIRTGIKRGNLQEEGSTIYRRMPIRPAKSPVKEYQSQFQKSDKSRRPTSSSLLEMLNVIGGSEQ